jgi:hypothetical protein
MHVSEGIEEIKQEVLLPEQSNEMQTKEKIEDAI